MAIPKRVSANRKTVASLLHSLLSQGSGAVGSVATDGGSTQEADPRPAIPAKQDVLGFKLGRLKATAAAISASAIHFAPPAHGGSRGMMRPSANRLP
jgi:hypothetical protein